MSSPAKSADRVKIVVYSKSPVKLPVLAALIQQLNAQKDRLESDVLTVPTAIKASVDQTTLTVLIISMHEKEELVEVLNVLTQVESRIQSGLLRAIVLNGLNHPRVMALLKAKGVGDIVDFSVNIKALNHKIKNALLLVSQTFQRLQNQNIKAATVIGNESRGAATARNTREASNEVAWIKSTEHPSDFWWIPSARNLRFVMGRWLADLLGPGPAAGLWEETTYERQGEKGWEWKTRVSTDPTFAPRAGRWLFFGKQPEFVWQKNLWNFVSKYPYLAFYAEGSGDPEYVRIESPTLGKVKIYENSETSRAYLPKIQASLEASIKLSKSESSDEVRGSFERPSESSGVSGGTFSGGGNTSTDLGGNYSSGSSAMGTGAGTNYSQGDLTPDAPAGSWNNHGSSVGVDFKAKDIRVDTRGAKAKWRNSLTPDAAVGEKMGMKDVTQAGITSGAKTFEKLSISVTLRLRNGQPVTLTDPLRVMEMTKKWATFEYPREWIVEKDKFTLRVEFRLGDVEKKFEVEWSTLSTQCIDGGGCLAHGEFTGGALGDLEAILVMVHQRQVELRDFFIVAKGA